MATTTNHSWTENAMRCSALRLQELKPNEHFSWAYYRINRERETLRALYELHWSGQSNN